MSVGMLIDLTKCIGCRGCQIACKQWNELPAEKTHNRGSYENPPKLSDKTWTYITFHEIADGSRVTWVFAKDGCRHCLEPSCASACIVGALHKRPDGAVVYNAHKCIGCRYCEMACPFGIPAFQWEKPVPYIQKCTFCEDRLDQGEEPACAKTCPTGAIEFGERNDLLQTAHARMKERPDKYVNHIYGEKEVGGTSVMYLSSVPFNKLGFPTYGPEPLPRYAHIAMNAVPPTIGVVTVLMGGVYWIIKRRDKMMSQETDGVTEPTEKEG